MVFQTTTLSVMRKEMRSSVNISQILQKVFKSKLAFSPWGDYLRFDLSLGLISAVNQHLWTGSELPYTLLVFAAPMTCCQRCTRGSAVLTSSSPQVVCPWEKR